MSCLLFQKTNSLTTELNYRATQPWPIFSLNGTLMAAFYFRSLWGRGLIVSNTINCCQTGNQCSLRGEAKTFVSVRIHVARRGFMWVLTHLGLSRDAMKYCRMWDWLRDTHMHGVFFFCVLLFLFFFKGCMLNSFGTPSCVEAPSSSKKKKKSPIRLIANCATIHFPYPAGHHIPVDQNKSATLDKDTHTHTAHCPTDPLCRPLECGPGNVTARQIRADSAQWHSGSRQPHPLCGTLTGLNLGAWES